MSVPPSAERDWVRHLARRVAEIAHSEENQRVYRRWRDVNALRRPDRAPVYCRPVGAWEELLPEAALRCADPYYRSVERDLRRLLIKHDIGDDTPFDPYFPVNASFRCDPPNVWGVQAARHRPSTAGGAWAYDPPLKSDADFQRLQLPVYTYDAPRTEAALQRAHDLLGDILPVQRQCGAPLSPTLCTDAADLRGLEALMLDMAEAPERVHRLMAHLRDGVLGAMDQVEATGLLTPNNTGPMFCSDPIGPAPSPGGSGTVTFRHCWGAANSQEFDQVSPGMWEEFLLQYQKPILARFGITQYGCCENLTRKIPGVLSIPNLRVFVCSAWTSLDKVIEHAGRSHVIMWRQKASDVVFPHHTDGIARHLDEGMRRLKGCAYQVVLRELQTLAGHPDRLHAWTRLAIEAAERHAS
ncbi:MAG: hypothetical protein QHJ73_11295 [Armatimonadota bacterium]|nr:hypothetical protein [Armatimonadota bacterium]